MKGNGKISASESKSTGLSTFGGVFTPSILTILGVIMYLRFGWVVGNVGLIGTLLIVTLSTGITFLTSLSIASIATDQKVKIGDIPFKDILEGVLKVPVEKIREKQKKKNKPNQK